MPSVQKNTQMTEIKNKNLPQLLKKTSPKKENMLWIQNFQRASVNPLKRNSLRRYSSVNLRKRSYSLWNDIFPNALVVERLVNMPFHEIMNFYKSRSIYQRNSTSNQVYSNYMESQSLSLFFLNRKTKKTQQLETTDIINQGKSYYGIRRVHHQHECLEDSKYNQTKYDCLYFYTPSDDNLNTIVHYLKFPMTSLNIFQHYARLKKMNEELERENSRFLKQRLTRYYLTKHDSWIPTFLGKQCYDADCSNTLSIGRRHHCRICGQMFCGDCCKLHEIEPILLPKQTRICQGCVNHSLKFVTTSSSM